MQENIPSYYKSGIISRWETTDQTSSFARKSIERLIEERKGERASFSDPSKNKKNEISRVHLHPHDKYDTYMCCVHNRTCDICISIHMCDLYNTKHVLQTQYLPKAAPRLRARKLLHVHHVTIVPRL